MTLKKKKKIQLPCLSLSSLSFWRRSRGVTSSRVWRETRVVVTAAAAAGKKTGTFHFSLRLNDIKTRSRKSSRTFNHRFEAGGKKKCY